MAGWGLEMLRAGLLSAGAGAKLLSPSRRSLRLLCVLIRRQASRAKKGKSVLRKLSATVACSLLQSISCQRERAAIPSTTELLQGCSSALWGPTPNTSTETRGGCGQQSVVPRGAVPTRGHPAAEPTALRHTACD